MDNITTNIKPLNIKLIIHINMAEYKQAIAQLHNVKPEEVQVIIDEPVLALPEPKDEENPRGEFVGAKNAPTERRGAKEPTFLHYFLRSRKFEIKEAAELCGVNKSTIARACVGQRLCKKSYDAIVNGLEMTSEETRDFKKSLKWKQRNYHGKERRAQ